MIHTADTKVARRYGDFFIRQIQKLDEVTMVTASSAFYDALLLQILAQGRRKLPTGH